MTNPAPPGADGIEPRSPGAPTADRRGGSAQRMPGRPVPGRATAGDVQLIGEAGRTRDGAFEREARARLLAEASRILAASLDVDAALDGVARLAVPMLGDWCVIDLDGEHEAPRRVTVAHADPDRDAGARRFQRLGPGDEGIPCGAPRALRSGVTELTASVSAADIAAVGDPVRRALLLELGVGAQLCVPLLARGRALGAFTFVLADAAHAFTPDDVAVAEDLAQRAAVAVDNARLYREAERASAAKSEFLAVMSHEFRTPLHVIVGFSDMLRMGIPVAVPPEALAHVERIGRATEHLLGLVEQLLTASRLGAGRERMDAEPTDVAALAREVGSLVDPLAAAKGLRLVVDVPAGGLLIVTDRGKVRQIVYNLLANAVKFTDRGEVALRVRHARDADGERIECEVRDTGIGIAPEHLGAVFDPFWQAEGTTSPRTDRNLLRAGRGGTGLGLSISRDLARLLGGELRVRSTLGEGTAFTLVLPGSAPGEAASGAGRERTTS